MKQLLVLLLWGAIISFLGSLPLNTMNIAITQIVLRDGNGAGYQFAAGAILVEIVYVRIALLSMKWFLKQSLLFRLFEWVTICLLLVLSISSFVAAINMNDLTDTIPLHIASPFLSGTFISLINPFHIPFWLGWSSILASKKILLPTRINYNIFVTGISAGSLLGFMVFIAGTRYVVVHLKSNEKFVQVTIGAILFLSVIVQLYKMRKKRYLKLSPVTG